MYRLYFFIAVQCFLFFTAMAQQPVQLQPSWVIENAHGLVQHHAAAGLISYVFNNQLRFVDAHTGKTVKDKTPRTDYCYVNPQRNYIMWAQTDLDSNIMRVWSGPFDSDVITDSSVLRMYEDGYDCIEWTILSASNANAPYFCTYGVRGNSTYAPVFIGKPDADINTWKFFESAVTRTIAIPSISRSGKMCGGPDRGSSAQVHFWDQIVFASPAGERVFPIVSGDLIWYDDISQVLITPYKLYDVRGPDPVALKSMRKDLQFHAPYADWTYVIASNQTDTSLYIVNLLTDQAVAECLTGSQGPLQVFSDVQDRYIVTYSSATDFNITGFVVPDSLVPTQLLVGVESAPSEHAGISIRPNPASEVAHIHIPTGSTQITITSALGTSCVVAIVPGTEVLDLPLLEFSSGVYVVNFSNTQTRALLHICR